MQQFLPGSKASLKVRTKAKINVFLEVVNRDEKTGYHFLHMLMVQLGSLEDIMEIEESDAFKVSVYGQFAFGGANILEKVVSAVRQKFGESFNTNFSVSIEKNIPTAGGLGGGSSNAGNFLNFLLQRNGVSLPQAEYAELALKIGADVPFFIDEKPKICKGFGEELFTPYFPIPKGIFALLVNPLISCSTKDVFGLFKKQDYRMEVRDVVSFEDALLRPNDLTKYATTVCPVISEILNFLEALGGIKAALSGSGATCFALFKSEREVLFALEKARENQAISKFFLAVSEVCT